MGVISLSWNYLVKVREGLFADMTIAMMDTPEPVNPNGNDNITPDVINEYNGENTYTIDYSSYLGILEIPKIRLKRGFYGVDSR